jgi:hypothetical protein
MIKCTMCGKQVDNVMKHKCPMKRAISKSDPALEDLLKMAYCKEKGSDSIVGLDCCDDYRDWCATLST